jgi:hypothetical protein
MQFERFETWADVVSYAREHGHVWYHAPLDTRPTKLEAKLPKRKPRNSTVPGDGWKSVIRLIPHAALDADPFYAFGDHLARMRRPVFGPLRGIAAGARVTCRYREGHQGVLLAAHDPRAWQGSLAFPGNDLPDVETVKAHVAKCTASGLLDDKQPVLWDFGKVYWDRYISEASSRVRVNRVNRSLVVATGTTGDVVECVQGLEHMHGCPAYMVRLDSGSTEMFFRDELDFRGPCSDFE